jgi:CHAT domain-containing protein/tetratricopeptide (TPR) repeat protein
LPVFKKMTVGAKNGVLLLKCLRCHSSSKSSQTNSSVSGDHNALLETKYQMRIGQLRNQARMKIKLNCLRQERSSLTFLFSILLAIAAPCYVLGDDASSELSTNPNVRKQEESVLSKLKKGKQEDQADALYDLGKYCYENHDLKRAEKYMNQSLGLEENLARPTSHIKILVNLAIIGAVEKKTAEAANYYQMALDIANKSKSKDFVKLITNSLGGLYLRSQDYDKAEPFLKKSYELSQADNDAASMMDALINQATLSRKRKNREQALALLNQAVALSEKCDPDIPVANTLSNLALLQHDLGNLDASVSSYKKAIEIFKQEIDVEAEGKTCFGLAETFYELQRISEAREFFQRGFDVLKDEPDNELKVRLLIGLGDAEADLGHSDAAQKFHTNAYNMATALKIRSRVLEAVLQLGNDLLLNGYPEAGLYRLLDGEKLAAEGDLDLSVRGAYMMAIGRCYKTLGQAESAEKYYDVALKLYEDAGAEQKSSRALVLNSLAVLALDNQNTDEFERYYHAAKALYSDADDKRDLAILDYNYAQYNFVQRKYQEASTLYTQALESIKGSGDLVSESMFLRGLGLAQLELNHPQQAMPFYDKALTLADQSGAIEAQWDSHLGLGLCFKTLGHNDLAVSHLTKAVDLVEKERGQLHRDSFKTYNLDQRSRCFVELVDLYILLKRPYEALATAEKGRARAFLDMLSSRKKGRSVESFQGPLSSRALPQAHEAPQIVAMAPAEPGSRGVSVLPKTSQIFSSSAISPANAAAPDIAEMKELVKNSKSTLVEYYILPDKLAVWVIDPDSTIHMLPPIPVSKQQLSEKVSLAYETITHQPKNQEEVATLARRRQDMMRELNDLLIKPLEQYLPKDEKSIITIVPHGPLFMIPFAALLSEDKKFLVERHTLAYIPAIGVMRTTQKLEQSFSTQPDKLLAFGNPITKAIEFLGKLPYSEREVKEIAALFGKDNAVLKIGQDADKKTFEDLAPQFSEIHLATHGLVDEEQPMQSSLILAPTKGDDGLLTVKDILAMKELKAKLVVLSACQTGRGKITGDGVVGLSRAFIIAGTPAVLVSQWNVDDIITEFQMKSFYTSYLAHSGKSKALRQAQLDTIKYMEGADLGKGINGLRANPRYWAAFQLVGDCS